MYIHVCTHMYVHTCMCIYVCMYIHVCTYIYVHTYMYVHTCMYVYCDCLYTVIQWKTSTSVLQGGNWANRTVEVKVCISYVCMYIVLARTGPFQTKMGLGH